MFALLKKVMADCAQSANGDYDPARVVGYGITALGGLVFLGLTVYIAIVKQEFNGSDFAIGLAGVSAAIGAAAAGVVWKKSTEIPLTSSVTVDRSDQTTTVTSETTGPVK